MRSERELFTSFNPSAQKSAGLAPKSLPGPKYAAVERRVTLARRGEALGIFEAKQMLGMRSRWGVEVLL
jgi:hypothetical protein